MQQLIIIAVIIILFLFVRWFRKQPPAKRWKSIFIIIVVGLVALTVSGRVHWLVAAGTALIPIFGALFKLIRFTPLIIGILNKLGIAKKQSTHFKSDSLILEVNPFNRSIDGTVLTGQFKNRKLSTMNEADISTFRNELAGHDSYAMHLLQAYLYARNLNKHSQQGSQSQSSSFNNYAMDANQAYRILELKQGCSKKDIINAHRRLIQKIHPDQGGSTYLTTLINQARDYLLNKQ